MQISAWATQKDFRPQRLLPNEDYNSHDPSVKTLYQTGFTVEQNDVVNVKTSRCHLFIALSASVNVIRHDSEMRAWLFREVERTLWLLINEHNCGPVTLYL